MLHVSGTPPSAPLATVGGVLEYKYMLFNDIQPEKPSLPIEVTPDGIVTVFSDIQPENAYLSIDVTLDGIVTVSSATQPANMLDPIVVTFA